MLVLHCTKKLRSRLGDLPAAAADAKSSTTLGDWTANLLFVGRLQLVLAVNHRTLLPVVVTAAPKTSFVPRLSIATTEVLLAMGIERDTALRESEKMLSCAVAPTNSRQVLGIVTDFGLALPYHLEARSLHAVALQLAQTPCSPLKMGRPMDAAREMFAAGSLH